MSGRQVDSPRPASLAYVGAILFAAGTRECIPYPRCRRKHDCHQSPVERCSPLSARFHLTPLVPVLLLGIGGSPQQRRVPVETAVFGGLEPRSFGGEALPSRLSRDA
jgi:hypothetical protein